MRTSQFIPGTEGGPTGGVAITPDGHLWVSGLHTLIEYLPAGGGPLQTIGSGVPSSVDGTFSTASFSTPGLLATDGFGNLLVPDTYGYRLRYVDFDAGTVTTLVGDGGPDWLTPVGVAVGPGGSIFIAEVGACRISALWPDGGIETLAGAAGCGTPRDGDGGTAIFAKPGGIAVDSEGDIFVSDPTYWTVRMIRGGYVSRLALQHVAGPGALRMSASNVLSVANSTDGTVDLVQLP